MLCYILSHLLEHVSDVLPVTGWNLANLNSAQINTQKHGFEYWRFFNVLLGDKDTYLTVSCGSERQEVGV